MPIISGIGWPRSDRRCERSSIRSAIRRATIRDVGRFRDLANEERDGTGLVASRAHIAHGSAIDDGYVSCDLSWEMSVGARFRRESIKTARYGLEDDPVDDDLSLAWGERNTAPRDLGRYEGGCFGHHGLLWARYENPAHVRGLPSASGVPEKWMHAVRKSWFLASR